MRLHAGAGGYVKVTVVDIDDVMKRSKELYERRAAFATTLLLHHF